MISRIEKLETFEQVVDLADELAKYCKKEQEEKEQELETMSLDSNSCSFFLFFFTIFANFQQGLQLVQGF